MTLSSDWQLLRVTRHERGETTTAVKSIRHVVSLFGSVNAGIRAEVERAGPHMFNRESFLLCSTCCNYYLKAAFLALISLWKRRTRAAAPTLSEPLKAASLAVCQLNDFIAIFSEYSDSCSDSLSRERLATFSGVIGHFWKLWRKSTYRSDSSPLLVLRAEEVPLRCSSAGDVHPSASGLWMNCACAKPSLWTRAGCKCQIFFVFICSSKHI